MRTLDDYLNRAKANHSLKSERQLAMRIDISPSGLLHLRSGKGYPTDETMIRIAHMAGADVGQALMDLNSWRTKSDAARSIYREAKRSLARTAGAGLIAASVLIPHGKSEASPGLERESLKAHSYIYYVNLIIPKTVTPDLPHCNMRP